MAKKTMGINPLQDYLNNSSQKIALEVQEQSSALDATGKKQRITIHLPIVLIERIKNAVYWEAGLTLTGLAEQAFEQALFELEKKRGAQYPERKERVLRSGRPIL